MCYKTAEEVSSLAVILTRMDKLSKSLFLMGIERKVILEKKVTPRSAHDPSWWLGGKESVCQCRRHQEDPLEEEMATYSSIFAWEIPWTEEPGGLSSMGPQRIRRD